MKCACATDTPALPLLPLLDSIFNISAGETSTGASPPLAHSTRHARDGHPRAQCRTSRKALVDAAQANGVQSWAAGCEAGSGAVRVGRSADSGTRRSASHASALKASSPQHHLQAAALRAGQARFALGSRSVAVMLACTGFSAVLACSTAAEDTRVARPKVAAIAQRTSGRRRRQISPIVRGVDVRLRLGSDDVYRAIVLVTLRASLSRVMSSSAAAPSRSDPAAPGWVRSTRSAH